MAREKEGDWVGEDDSHAGRVIKVLWGAFGPYKNNLAQRVELSGEIDWANKNKGLHLEWRTIKWISPFIKDANKSYLGDEVARVMKDRLLILI